MSRFNSSVLGCVISAIQVERIVSCTIMLLGSSDVALDVQVFSLCFSHSFYMGNNTLLTSLPVACQTIIKTSNLSKLCIK